MCYAPGVFTASYEIQTINRVGVLDFDSVIEERI
jgi:hypothetical protein